VTDDLAGSFAARTRSIAASAQVRGKTPDQFANGLKNHFQPNVVKIFDRQPRKNEHFTARVAELGLTSCYCSAYDWTPVVCHAVSKFR